ncbi:hypothetical protein ASPZODRAFT_74944 [Penicilliopsis zonata CBS 506.65]|uniref:Uncharacterized protein n=1 Tax=Penicilliopsis zonata CBS 506.65 TaxID=1073090 RepID=A0A1L9S7L8_9EURO|nr:hypothetical protein ASPZODRAFT_74944 [Penicilliopsis zonata CBS 506.65]OJJ43139.1 hypothetical protein ASPZODRAFT_74944 [Penicilliopsis zonata CBS 506.65]
MSKSRNITDYFKRPDFSAVRDPDEETTEDCQVRRAESEALPQTKPTPLFASFADSVGSASRQSSLPVGSSFAGRSSFDGSTSLSQRVVRNGREVVISSDGEYTDAESLEDPEDLFRILDTTATSTTTKVQQEKEEEMPPRKTGKPSKFSSSSIDKLPKYKFTLDSLVTHTVDDNETEAGVSKVRAAYDAAEKESAAARENGGRLRETLLASALGTGDKNDDASDIQRLLHAVRRTEALDQDKAWYFFKQGVSSSSPSHPLPPKFPASKVSARTYEAVLRDPTTRARAFQSGTLDVALARHMLPEEVVLWIFQSASSEQRDDLRHAYCRAFKVTSLILPKHIDTLFETLGATSDSLDLSKPLIPASSETGSLGHKEFQTQSLLLSSLDLLRGTADRFARRTRVHILLILFRLAIDISITSNSIVCSELEGTITALLESGLKPDAENMARQISQAVYDTVNDAEFQARLLRHILPTSDWIALLRCRLAVSFLLRDPAPLTEAPEAVLDLNRITAVLKEKRFDVKAFKAKDQGEYDFGELGAITVLLNIAIDSSWAKLRAGAEGETNREYNAAVDALADRIKKIFTSIADSGASHLRRTQAKEALEALHYRTVYSIRSKPPPKKTLFGPKNDQDWEDIEKSRAAFAQFTKGRTKAEIAIRPHDPS